MRKLIISVIVLCLTAAVLASCTDNGNETVTTALTDNTEATVTASASTAEATQTETSASVTSAPVTTSDATVKESVTEQFEGYIAKTNTEVFIADTESVEGFDFTGSGETLLEVFASKKYASYTVKYYTRNEDKYKAAGTNAVKRLGAIYASYTIDKTKKTADVYIQDATVDIVPDHIYYEGEEGTFISVSFRTNIAADFKVSIGLKGSVDGTINHEKILPTGKKGDYVGIGQMTIPYVGEGNFYVNISSGGKVLKTIPITVKKTTNPSPYHLLMTGAWDLIDSDEYRKNLVKLFYDVYPRLYARWGTGKEPKTITFVADRLYDGVAYCSGTKVVVATDYAKNNHNDLGFFAHEITHSVQQYTGIKTEWWVENMANYGGFRYFHWNRPEYVQVFFPNDKSLQNWNYEPYGNNKWFFTYMDSMYPTTPEGGLGLIDTINMAIKQGKISNDDPKDPTNSLNRYVKDITGFETIEALRLHYVEDLENGVWTFTGFGSFKDKYLTEGIDNLPDSTYPEYVGVVHGNKTGGILTATVIEGDNLALGATIVTSSGMTRKTEIAEMAVDGKVNTKWCATDSTIYDNSAALYGADKYIIIDLGETKTFNTYTLIFAGLSEKTEYNPRSWEVTVSNDCENWTSIDYQEGNVKSSATVNVGSVSARYVCLNLFEAEQSGNTARIYEIMLFNK